MPIHEKLIMFEGIDGSGKGSLARAFASELAGSVREIFDISVAGRESGDIPFHSPSAERVAITSEPTHAWIGAAIRKEFIRNGTKYPSRVVAEAYSWDRYLLYHRFILPTLAAGAFVISERGLPSSVVYQPAMAGDLSVEDVLACVGNAFVFEHAPKHLIVIKLSAATAVGRLGGRAEKMDDAIFENEKFLAKVAERYESEWFRKLWESRGTTVHYLDAERPLDEVIAAVKKLARELYPMPENENKQTSLLP